MAKQFETSSERFAHRESFPPWLILSAVILACLAGLLVMAAAKQNWPFASLTLVALGTAVVFLVFNVWTSRRATARSDQKRIDWTTAQPEIQRQNLNIEVFELSKILEVESEQISDLQSAYIVAEDLALRQIQHDESLPLMRHVNVGKAPFNAVFAKCDVLNCIDVFFLVVPELRQEKIDAMLRKIGQVKKAFAEMNVRMKVRLMMVLVTQLSEENNDRLREALGRQKFERTPVDIDIRLLDFESLQKIYVTD
ncbi:MAG: hypothetical protein HOP17_06025 [Acidobacteria bacterium]|nr:hypothetical protein [Acidobacteriota bacterium]